MQYLHLAGLLLSTQLSRVAASSGSDWNVALYGGNLCGGSDSVYDGSAITQCANITGIFSFDGSTGDGTSTDVDICFYTETNCAGGPAILTGDNGFCGCPNGDDSSTIGFASWCVSPTGQCPQESEGSTAGCD